MGTDLKTNTIAVKELLALIDQLRVKLEIVTGLLDARNTECNGDRATPTSVRVVNESKHLLKYSESFVSSLKEGHPSAGKE